MRLSAFDWIGFKPGDERIGRPEDWQTGAGVHVKSRFGVSDPEGKERRVELELRDLKVGAQPPGVFEVPEGYKVMPLDAGALLRDVLGF